MVDQIRPLNSRGYSKTKKFRKGSSCGFKKENAGKITQALQNLSGRIWTETFDRTEILHTIKLKTPQCNVKNQQKQQQKQQQQKDIQIQKLDLL